MQKREIPWWLVILLLMTAWPLGFIFLMFKLFGGGEERRAVSQPRRGGYRDKNIKNVKYSSTEGEVGARLHPSFAQKLERLPSQTKGKVLRGIGIALTFFGSLFGLIILLAMLSDYYWFYEAFMASGIAFLSMGGPGIGLMVWGQRILDKARRSLRYSRLVGDSEEVSLDRLAGALGVSYEKVCDDLSGLLDSGLFAGYYIDRERRVLTCGQLTMSHRASVTEPVQEEPAAEPAIHPADQIRAIHMQIVQPEVSRKVEQLEMLTRRIYNYTDAYPEKDKLARSFKARYLPKTIKILESYSRFEKSGSSGENVRTAMQEVEAVLDVLLQSFEKQLDMLYMDEALDVSTDIDVLESMISGDGLGQSPFAQGM